MGGSWGFFHHQRRAADAHLTSLSPYCISSYLNDNVRHFRHLEMSETVTAGLASFPASTQSCSESFHTVSEHLSTMMVMQFSQLNVLR